MSNIDWSKAPTSADRIVENPMDSSLHWGNGKKVLIHGNWKSNAWGYHAVATHPTTPPEEQRKTVEDAVAAYPGGWPEEPDFVCLWNSKDERFEFWLKGCHPVGWCYQVCTREEFEACVAAKSKPEWTHTYHGDKCSVLLDEPDCDGWVVIAIDGTGYHTCLPKHLKPIKPTITKAEAWELASVQGISIDCIKKLNTITD
tara:strand:+ start:1803 stop:2402 length:600 start_codon:yes stop_codon:yes gene_type:complete